MVVSTITFIARDGSRFDKEESAINHEELLDEIERIFRRLGKPQSLASNECIQHELSVCFDVKEEFYDLVKAKYKDSNYGVLTNPSRDIHPMSFIGRMLDDMGGIWARTNYRLCCINWSTGIEYQQPYFAINGPRHTEKMRILKPKF